MFLHIIYFIFLLVAVWFGSGLVVNSADRLRKKARISSFVVSFFLLGFLTSLPELAIGLNSISEGRPEIFVGNLLGATAVIFLLIIPLLAIFGNGIKLKHKLSKLSFFLVLLVSLAPSFFILDKKITSFEAVVLVLCYAFATYLLQSKYRMLDIKKRKILSLKKYSLSDVLKISLGIIVIFWAGQSLVDKTLYFSGLWQISPFYIGLLGISLGTNIPELSIAIRSIVSGKKEIAFGNYLGSASANTFLFGFFSILNNGEVLTVNSFLATFVFVSIGIVSFYYFSRSQNDISRKEGLLLLIGYILFCFFELQK